MSQPDDANDGSLKRTAEDAGLGVIEVPPSVEFAVEATAGDVAAFAEGDGEDDQGDSNDDGKAEETDNDGKPPAFKKRRTKRKGRPWNEMLYELLKFKSKHGHCRVPGSKGSLGAWVVQQRQQYHNLRAKQAEEEDHKLAAVENGEGKLQEEPIKKSRSSSLTEERIEVLNTIDFVWDVVQFDNDVRWNIKYQELKEFVRINGHAVVPQSTPLGQWVKMQRENKKEADLKAAGMRPKRTKQRPCLSKDREEKLNAIGFQWKVAKPPVGWERRFEQLVEYQRIHGDCNVPQSYPPDKSFGRWVMKQRCEYSLKLRSLKSQLTDEREARLNAIGFSWVAPNFKRKTVPADDLGDDVMRGDDSAAMAILHGPTTIHQMGV